MATSQQPVDDDHSDPVDGSGTQSLGRNYWRLWCASALSNLGDGTSLVAYPWLASLLTRDPVLIAGALAVTRVPWLLFSLPAGVIVDRHDRRRIMAGANACRAVMALAVAVLVVTGNMTIGLLYASVLLLGCAEVLYDNAAETIMPRLVRPEQLERANGRLWSAEMVLNQLAGPPLGGLLLAVSVSLPFFLDAATFAGAALLLLLIGGVFTAEREPASPGQARPSPIQDAKDGMRFLWRHSFLRVLAITLGVLNATMTMAIATYVLFVQEVLGLGSGGYGFLMTAGAIGGILGSLGAEAVARRVGSSVSLNGLFVVGTVTHLLIALTGLPAVVMAMNFAFTFAAMVWNVVAVSLRQRIIPDRMLGRVTAANRWLAWGMMPIGAAVSGGLVAAVEPLVGRDWAVRSPLLLAGLVFAVTGALVARHFTTARIEQVRESIGADAPAGQ